MRKSTRRKAGGLVTLFVPVIVAALAVADVPLVTVSEQHFDANGATAYSVKPQWPLIVASIVFIGALALVFLPRHERS